MNTYPLYQYGGLIYSEFGDQRVVIDTGAPVSMGWGELTIGERSHRLHFEYADLHFHRLRREMFCYIDGVVGNDILADYEVVFDLEAQTLSLRPLSTVRPEGAHPLSPVGRVPIVRVRVDGRACDLFFDTGTRATFIESAPLAALESDGHMRAYSPGLGWYGTDTYPVPLELDSQSGPTQVTMPVGVPPDEMLDLFGRARVAGSLGNAILENFRVTLNLAERWSLLEASGPPPKPAEPIAPPWLRWRRDRSQPVVAGVEVEFVGRFVPGDRYKTNDPADLVRGRTEVARWAHKMVDEDFAAFAIHTGRVEPGFVETRVVAEPASWTELFHFSPEAEPHPIFSVPRPTTLWYPSAGRDFRPLVYLMPEYLKGMPLDIPTPQLFVHTCLDFPGYEPRFEVGRVLYDDHFTRITVRSAQRAYLNRELVDYYIDRSFLTFNACDPRDRAARAKAAERLDEPGPYWTEMLETVPDRPECHLVDVEVRSKISMGCRVFTVLYIEMENNNCFDTLMARGVFDWQYLCVTREGYSPGGGCRRPIFRHIYDEGRIQYAIDAGCDPRYVMTWDAGLDDYFREHAGKRYPDAERKARYMGEKGVFIPHHLYQLY